VRAGPPPSAVVDDPLAGERLLGHARDSTSKANAQRESNLRRRGDSGEEHGGACGAAVAASEPESSGKRDYARADVTLGGCRPATLFRSMQAHRGRAGVLNEIGKAPPLRRSTWRGDRILILAKVSELWKPRNWSLLLRDHLTASCTSRRRWAPQEMMMPCGLQRGEGMRRVGSTTRRSSSKT